MWQSLLNRVPRRWLVAGGAIGAAIVAGGFYMNGRDTGAHSAYRLARIERGPIAAAVSASGTVNAVVTVQVGSQLSGQIQAIYADFNSEVKKDQPVAVLDPQTFQARVNQAQAELEVAKASVLTQEASVERWRAEVRNAHAAMTVAKAQTAKSKAAKDETERDFTRKNALVQRGFISSSDIDKARSAADSAAAQLNASVAQERAQEASIGSSEAQLRMAEAGVANAMAAVKQKEAALQQSQIDLDRTIIRAPLDGVVVLRNVDVGQTVAASLQAPTLFTIAQDLRVMEVYTTVDQADIGRIRVGQNSSFTVDSYPGRTFSGQVSQIRIAPQTVQNVVTYIVVISGANPDQRLLPGMTANVRIETAERADVLKVPNSALRYRPPGVGAVVAGDGERGSGAQDGERGGGERGGAGGEAGSPEQRVERLAKELNLTPEQKDQVTQIFTEARQQFQAARRQAGQQRGGQQGGQEGGEAAQGGSASAGNGAVDRQRMFAAVRERVAAVLTPAQRQRYREMTARMANTDRPTPGRVWIVGPDGKPLAVSIQIGIGDGNVSELVSGDLKEGQQVIIGGGAALAGTSTQNQGLPRPPGRL